MNKPVHWSNERWMAWQARERAMHALRMHDAQSAETQQERDARRLELVNDLTAKETFLATFAGEGSSEVP